MAIRAVGEVTTKVLLVGLDGAERSLVDAWTRDGRLRTLADLRTRGRWGFVEPQPGLADDAAWASFSTTLGPARHGRFYHDRLAPDGVTLVPHRRDDIVVAPFWDAVVGAGRRVAVVDVPKSPMGHDDAFVVADWMTHGAEGTTRLSRVAAAHPMAERIELELDTSFDCDGVGSTGEDVAAFDHELIHRTEHRTAILHELLAGDEWDLFVAVFAAPHCAGHRAWRDHDPLHPEHDPRRRALVGDVVEHVYAATDRGLQTLVDAAGDDALVIAFSLFGMGANYHGTHLVEEVLRQAAGAAPSPVTRLLDQVRRGVPSSLRRRTPMPVAELARSMRIRNERAKPYRVLPFDLATTALRIAAADSHTDAQGVRHVPLAARRELVDVLGAIVDPDSGRPLVEEVVFTTDAYPGAASFIDAFVVWDASAPITTVLLDGVGAIHRPTPPLRSGNYRPGGWFVAAGPGIAPSADPTCCAIADLGATVAAQLDVVLTTTEGRVIREITSQPGARSASPRRPRG